MSEFSTTTMLEVQVDQSSLRSAKREIESSISDPEVSASNRMSTRRPGSVRSSRRRPAFSGSLSAVRGDGFSTLVDLAEVRNELLVETIDEIEQGFRSLLAVVARAGAGSGLLGILDVGADVGTEVGGTIADGVSTAVGSAVGTAVGSAISSSEVSIEDSDALTVKQPEWVPLTVEESGPLDIEDPSPLDVEDPSPFGVEDPSPLGVEDPSPLGVDDPSPLNISGEKLPLPVDAPESIPLDASNLEVGVSVSSTMTTSTQTSGSSASGERSDRGGPLSFLFGASPARAVERVPVIGDDLAQAERDATRDVYEFFGQDPSRVEPLNPRSTQTETQGSGTGNRSTTRRQETKVEVNVDARDSRNTQEVMRQIKRRLSEVERQLERQQQAFRGRR